MDLDLYTEQLSTSLGTYLPTVLGAILILVVGIVVALLVRAGIRRGMNALRVNERVGQETETSLDVSKIAASIGFWFVIVLTLIGVFSVLQIEGLSDPLSDLAGTVMLYLPRILLAGILALVAWLVATVLRTGITRLAARSGWDEKLAASAEVKPVAPLLGNVVYWLVLLLFLPAIVGALRVEGLMQPLTAMTQQFVGALPEIFSAIVIGLVGWLIAKVLRGLVTNLLAAAGIDRFSDREGVTDGVKLSQLGGTLAFILVIVPTLIAALEALDIEAVSAPATDMLAMFLEAVPNILAAALILIIAWFVGRFVAGLLTRLLENLGFDGLPQRLGFAHAFDDDGRGADRIVMPGERASAARAQVPDSPSPAVPIQTGVDGRAVTQSQVGATAGRPVVTGDTRWSLSQMAGHVALFFIMLFATVEAAHRLGFGGVRNLLGDLIDFSADVLLGVVILAVGYWLASLAGRAIERANAEHATGLARIAKVAILGLVLAMGLRAMGIADEIVNLAFGLVLGAVAIAIAVAFGVGGRQAAGRIADRWAQEYLDRDGRPKGSAPPRPPVA